MRLIKIVGCVAACPPQAQTKQLKKPNELLNVNSTYSLISISESPKEFEESEA